MEGLKSVLTLGFMKGYRTYFIVALFVLLVAFEKLGGVDIPGFEAGDNWLDQVLMALGLGTLRAAVPAAPSA